jgi:hypothetical protein
MPTRRQLGMTVAILFLYLVAINFGVAFLTRNSVPRRVLRRAQDAQAARVLALGNSLMAAGFDESAFDSTSGLTPPQGAINLGLGASSPVEQLLLLRYSLAHGIRPRLLIYGFYDFQLTEPIRFTSGDMIGNHAMLYYVEPSYARHFYSLSPHDSLEFSALHGIPMFADRGAIWAKVELLRRSLARQGMPAEANNQFGRVADFSLLESASSGEFQMKCEASMSMPLNPAVNELLRQAHEANIAISIVEMPMRGYHRESFYENQSWKDYIAHVRDLFSPYHATFIDASDWVENDSLFADSLHLSSEGAAILSRRLGESFVLETAPIAKNTAESSRDLTSIY